MDLVVLNEKETPYALRGLRDVVASNGTITPAERRFIEVVAELHGTTVDVDSMGSIAPGELAEVIKEPHQRKRVVQLATIAAMVEGDVTAAEAAAVKRLAAARAVDGYTGLFDVPKVLRAAQRGAACKVDLSDHWDLFAVADAPLEQIRAEYGIPVLQ
jgi:hypothetical protein